jgi:hypothetical protein
MSIFLTRRERQALDKLGASGVKFRPRVSHAERQGVGTLDLRQPETLPSTGSG